MQILPSTLSCHRSAQDAEYFDRQIKKQYVGENLSGEIQSLVSSINFPLVLKIDKNNYKYISGWDNLKANKKNKIFVILLGDSLDDNQIKNISWSYVISNQMWSWHRSSNLSSMVGFLRSCPKDLLDSQIQKINQLKSTQIKSELILTEFLSNETRAVVRNQITKNTQNITQTVKAEPSIFDRLTNK